MAFPFRIERGLPVPARITSPLVLALEGMEVGDSFVVPARRQTAVHSAARKLQISVRTRREEGDPSRVRVWKTAERPVPCVLPPAA
jgi:hypothetical protein